MELQIVEMLKKEFAFFHALSSFLSHKKLPKLLYVETRNSVANCD